jgi:hypothetical protein
MTTISIVTALYGSQYTQYISRWWAAVEKLNRQPDQIVLATPLDNHFGLIESIPDKYKNSVKHIEADASGVHGPWYAGIGATDGDWIFGCGIDDQFSPDAFDEVEQATEAKADLIIDRIEYLQGGDWPAVWNPENYRNRHFAPGGVAGYTKNIKHYWNLIPPNLRWNDNAFYALCVKNNIQVYRAKTTRMIHDLGTNHQTISGVNRDMSQDRQAYSEANAYIESLGIQL